MLLLQVSSNSEFKHYTNVAAQMVCAPKKMKQKTFFFNFQYVSFLETHSIDLYFIYILAYRSSYKFRKKTQMEKKVGLRTTKEQTMAIDKILFGIFLCDWICKMNSRKFGEHMVCFYCLFWLLLFRPIEYQRCRFRFAIFFC